MRLIQIYFEAVTHTTYNIRSLNTKRRLSKRDPGYETTRRGISTFIFCSRTSLPHVQTCMPRACFCTWRRVCTRLHAIARVCARGPASAQSPHCNRCGWRVTRACYATNSHLSLTMHRKSNLEFFMCKFPNKINSIFCLTVLTSFIADLYYIDIISIYV